MSTPLISVIVPTYQRNDLLAKCLDCLAPEIQTLPAEQYEVIVTDDGSNTNAFEMMRLHYPWAKWVAGSRKGPAANRNNGAKYAQGEWLTFTDDDCLPDCWWLEEYAKAIVAASCLVFEGRTYVDRPKQTLAETSPLNEHGGYLWSCNFAIQKQLFHSLAGFEERFPYAAMEDVELRLRLQKVGHKFSFIKAASVCHPWRPKGGWKKLKQQHQESMFIYLSLHPEQAREIDFTYYFRLWLWILVKDTLPGIFKFKFKGVKAAVIEHVVLLQMAFILFYKSLFNQIITVNDKSIS